MPTLRAVLGAGHEVALVLTQPDRPAGRRMKLQASPVKRLALEHGLPVEQPERIKSNEELRAQLERITPDAILVVAYGRIIPQWMLNLPRFGNLNLHGSLLPKYRGAAPIQWAVAKGETVTGVTTMQLDAGLDTGDVLLERRVHIGPETTAAELFPVLARVGAALREEIFSGPFESVAFVLGIANIVLLIRRSIWNGCAEAAGSCFGDFRADFDAGGWADAAWGADHAGGV